MKKFLLTILSLSLLIGTNALVLLAQTTQAKDANGLLYKITGKNLKTASYIFGTIHVICPNDMISVDKLQTYLAQTDRLIMEIDMDNVDEMKAMSRAAFMPDGKTIKDFLTPEQYAKVDELIKNSLGVSVEKVKNFKPMMLQVAISTNPKVLGCSTPASYESSLLKAAAAYQKTVEGLESVDFQLEVLNKTPLEKQAKDLYEMAVNPQKSIDEFKKLLEIYKTQNTENLYQYMNSQMKNNKEFKTNLLDNRNAVWVPKIEKAINEKSSFIAVGGGHLGGKKGLIKSLRSKGYKVEAVKL